MHWRRFCWEEDKQRGIAAWVELRGKGIAGVLGLKRKSMPGHRAYRRLLAGGVDEEEIEQLIQKYFQQQVRGI